MNRKLSYLIIVVCLVLAIKKLSFPDLHALTGKTSAPVYKKVDINTWANYVASLKNQNTKAVAKYRNPFTGTGATKGRKKGRAKKVASTVKPSALREYTITGMVAKRAVTVTDRDGRVSVLKIGDSLEGAMLESIAGTTASFKGPTGTFSLSLK
ncbi:MAG: hypothetical protein OCC49_02525 [Fibrobacterales bacterium]